MKLAVRLYTFCAVLLLLVGMTGGRAWAQNPDPQFDSAFANIPKAEKADPATLDQIYDAYMKVYRDNSDKNKELAADAVLRTALFAYNGLKAFPENPTSQEDQHILTKWMEEAKKIHEPLRKLTDGTEFPGTRAAATVKQPIWPDVMTHQQAGLLPALEAEWDRRNAHDWRYQIIDGLVKMTGANPGFSYWFALMLIAIIAKGLTFPLMLRTYKSQREMQKVAPLVKELQEKYKGKPELNEKMMALYREHKINPFASCVPMLIQLPFLIGVYQSIQMYEYHFAFGKFLWIGSHLASLYPAYLAPDLARFDVPLLLIYAASNYLTMRLTPQPDPAQAQQQKTMSVMMTGMMIFLFLQYRWSAAFIFYWLIMNFISAAQSYYYVYKPNKVKLAGGGGSTFGGNPPSSASGTSASNGVGGSLSSTRPATALPSGETMRPRPKRRGKR